MGERDPVIVGQPLGRHRIASRGLCCDFPQKRNSFQTDTTSGKSMPVGGRVAGKIGYISNSSSDRSYTGVNEEIIWTCIGMSIIIAVLITMALCYIAREKCRKRNEYYISA